MQSLVALSSYGAGSMIVALALPSILDRLSDRSTMLGGAALLGMSLGALAITSGFSHFNWPSLLIGWFMLGTATCAVLTPAGRLLRHSAKEADLPSLFAAQFALSHACWLLTYPLAGYLGRSLGMSETIAVFACVTLVGFVAALHVWPRNDPVVIEHVHDNLVPGHPHLDDIIWLDERPRHTHAFVIDDLHRHWPKG